MDAKQLSKLINKSNKNIDESYARLAYPEFGDAAIKVLEYMQKNDFYSKHELDELHDDVEIKLTHFYNKEH